MGVGVEIVEFSQVLQQGTGGRPLGDELLAAVVRAGIVTASLVQREVRAEVTAATGPCRRWFTVPGSAEIAVGLSDEDATGFVELLFGAPVVRVARPLAPIERRVLGTHLAPFLAPVALALGHSIDVDAPLVECGEPPAGIDWTRFGVIFNVEGAALACTIAVQDNRLVGVVPTGSDSLTIDRIFVEAQVELRHIRVTYGELAALRPGDVLSCGSREDDPIGAWIDDRLAFEGTVIADEDGLVFHIITNHLEHVA
jgi:hypothetical protein